MCSTLLCRWCTLLCAACCTVCCLCTTYPMYSKYHTCATTRYSTVDIHSHVLKYTEVWRILLMAHHGYCYLLIHLHSITHSTHSSVTYTTTLSTTSYTSALTMVVRIRVPMWPSVCSYVYLSVGLCVAVPASAIGHRRLQYFLLLHPE